MVQARCMGKMKEWGKNTYGTYIIQDAQGHIKDFKADELKALIDAEQINVVNLKLTSDKRLIDVKPKMECAKGEKCQITYETVVFFNRAILEMSDHAEHTRQMLVDVAKGQVPKITCGMSAGDDIKSFYQQYKQNKDKIPMDAVKAVLNVGNNKYTQLYNLMVSYHAARRNAPDAFFMKLCEITNKPVSFIPTMKEDLYCIYNEYNK